MSGFGWSTDNTQPRFPVQPNAPVPTLPTQQTAYYPILTPFVVPPSGIPSNEIPIRPVHYGAAFSAPPAGSGHEGPLVPEFFWVESSVKSEIPVNAVEGGFDGDGTKIYIGLAKHEGDEIPAKVIPEKSAAYISYGGKEISVEKYKVLCQHQLKWVSFNGKIPANAIPAGQTKNGETLYVGRAPIDGSLTVGKVHPSNNCCYIPYGGAEHSISKQFEILTRS